MAPDELSTILLIWGTFTYDLKYYLFRKEQLGIYFLFRVWCRTSKNKGTEGLSRVYSCGMKAALPTRHPGERWNGARAWFDQAPLPGEKSWWEDGETRFPAQQNFN